jgi:hypothetical protein
VRKKQAIVIKEDDKQRSLWADMESAPPGHMKLSLQQRRRGVQGDVKQLKTDRDSSNENNNPGPPSQMSFKFDEALQERGAEGTDTDEPPEDDEEAQ